jgi:hypothetical protein
LGNHLQSGRGRSALISGPLRNAIDGGRHILSMASLFRFDKTRIEERRRGCLSNDEFPPDSAET